MVKERERTADHYTGIYRLDITCIFGIQNCTCEGTNCKCIKTNLRENSP